MENYQMFFPCSSSVAPPTYGGGGGGAISFGGGTAYPSGPLGLKPGNDMVDVVRSSAPQFNEYHQHHQQQQQQHHHHHGSSHYIGNNYQLDPPPGSSEKIAGKKKGEKKLRRPKFAFQTRSQVDILDDGYRWRKYGQKAVKNNKFPRSYYRCTHQGCNVKKQVQRLTRDESVVVTTYEGTHTHPVEKSMDNFEHILSQMQIYPLPIN